MFRHRQELLLAIAKGEKLAAAGVLDKSSARQLSVLMRSLRDELAALQAFIDQTK